mmetsp:Transcript_62203/g.145786  ORF Transcript_62203/g.145786 Transcript_62203/m.145786 type:complete len:388 (-) Transcript_62203:9-1172(-)
MERGALRFRRSASHAILCLLGAACFVNVNVHRPVPQSRLTRKAGAPEPRQGVDWESLGFGLTTKETQMVVARCKLGGEWSTFEVQPYGPLPLEPATTALNYGQSIFEGLKAFRTSKSRLVLFRPDKNAQRMAGGAERFLMPPVPKELFLKMCLEAVRSNADWVPPSGQGSLYLRPLLFGSGPALGVGPSPEFTFVIYVAPVGSYFSGAGARLRVEQGHHRAAELGVGDVKAAGNYAPCFSPQKDAKGAGFSDILYFDPSGSRVEEAAASNFFCVTEDGVLKTPELGTILSGVTRDSVLQLARKLAGTEHLKSVEEGDLSWHDILNAKEAFVTGTAAAVTPVQHVEFDKEQVDLPSPGPLTALLKETYGEIQQELRPDEEGWLVDAFP